MVLARVMNVFPEDCTTARRLMTDNKMMQAELEPTMLETDTISILYVEDDPKARNTLLSILLRTYPELQIYTAGNGLIGLEMFQRLRPTVVITDISMPEMDGISMASEIKAVAPDVIIIALTAHSETSNLIRAIEIGITHYVLKPLDFERIRSVIDQSITCVRKERQLHNQYEQIVALNAALTARTQELESLNIELEAFNFTVAHDLRSPIINIGNFAQSLLDMNAAEREEHSDRNLQIVCKEVRHMNGLIGALLNFSLYARKSIVKEWTNLSRIVNEITANLVQHNPRRNITFTIDDGVHGFGDPILLGVALENLLGNAWKYSEKKDPACIEFGAQNIDEEYVYYVRDNGVGFDCTETSNLFVPFKRLQCNNDFEGFGIGLATTCRIIQRHGGKIWAEGKKDRGATFYFSL